MCWRGQWGTHCWLMTCQMISSDWRRVRRGIPSWRVLPPSGSPASWLGFPGECTEDVNDGCGGRWSQRPAGRQKSLGAEAFPRDYGWAGCVLVLGYLPPACCCWCRLLPPLPVAPAIGRVEFRRPPLPASFISPPVHVPYRTHHTHARRIMLLGPLARPSTSRAGAALARGVSASLRLWVAPAQLTRALAPQPCSSPQRSRPVCGPASCTRHRVRQSHILTPSSLSSACRSTA